LKKNNQLFPELRPTERILRIIAEYVFPPLEKEGFKLLKSGYIKREVNQYIQEIRFSRSKWNTGNEICAFTPNFTVIIKNYKKWHEFKYDELPLNDVLYSLTAKYLKDWNRELYEYDSYDFAKDDNYRIIELLNGNISKCGLPFFNKLSNYQTAVQLLVASEHYYIAPKMIDICLMNEDYKLANEVVKWFRDYEKTERSEFMESTLAGMSNREKKIKEL